MTEDLYYVNSSKKNGVATISFYHPKGNSFPSSQLKALREKIKTLGDNEEIKVIILKSEGEKVFCAGASFDELMTIKNKEVGRGFFMGFAKVLMAMKDCPKFIIGSIQGKAVGGGVGLISACDYVIAMDSASIKLSELSIGIGPFVIEPAISRKIGVNAFSELTLKPKEWKNADWALRKGMYNSICTSQQELEKEVGIYAKQLSEYSLEAMKSLKEIIWEGTEDWQNIMEERAEISGTLVLSEFTKETIAKFKNK